MDRELEELVSVARKLFPRMTVQSGRVGVNDHAVDGDLWIRLRAPGRHSYLIGFDDARWREQICAWTEAMVFERMREDVGDCAA